jgi:hypothetical protein
VFHLWLKIPLARSSTSFFQNRREIVDARVAVAFEFCVGGQQREFVDARGGYDELVGGVVDRKFRQPGGFDDDIGGTAALSQCDKSIGRESFPC